MTTLATLLMGLGLPLVLRVLAGLGVSLITFAAVTEGVQGLLAIAQANWAGLPVSTLQLATLSGIPEAMGIIMGAYMARWSLWMAVNAARWVVR